MTARYLTAPAIRYSARLPVNVAFPLRTNMGDDSEFSFEILIDDDLRIVRTICRGELTMATAPEVTQRARETATSRGYNLLFDLREARINVSTLDILHYPRELDVFQDPNARRARAALVVSSNDKLDDWSFYEVAAQNTGLNLQVFVDDRDAAMKWLVGGEKEC